MQFYQSKHQIAEAGPSKSVNTNSIKILGDIEEVNMMEFPDSNEFASANNGFASAQFSSGSMNGL